MSTDPIASNTLSSPKKLGFDSDFVKARDLAANLYPFIIENAIAFKSSFGDQVALAIHMVDKETGLPLDIRDEKTGKQKPECYTLTLRVTPMREKYITWFAEKQGPIGLCYVASVASKTPGQNPTWVIRDFSDLMREQYGEQGALPLDEKGPEDIAPAVAATGKKSKT